MLLKFWQILSLGLFVTMTLNTILYAIKTQLLTSNVKKSHPKTHLKIGSPNSIADLSLRHNPDVYQAFTSFMKLKSYLNIIDSALRQQFIDLNNFKKRGIPLAIITMANFVAFLLFFALNTG